MTTETQPSDNTINCPRCGHAFNNIDQRFNCTQIVCPDCATGFTWEHYPKPDLAIPFTELDKLPIGSIVEDKDGDQWVRVNGGWIWAEAGGSDVLTPRETPYTVTHTPTV